MHQAVSAPNPPPTGSSALAAVDHKDGPVAWFNLNTEANVEVDITALDALDALRRELDRRCIVLALAGQAGPPRRPGRVRADRQGRPRAHLPDAAHGRRRVRAVAATSSAAHRPAGGDAPATS